MGDHAESTESHATLEFCLLYYYTEVMRNMLRKHFFVWFISLLKPQQLNQFKKEVGMTGLKEKFWLTICNYKEYNSRYQIA